ncbi:MAG: ABC transporter ATP-binding protein [Candidatus Heimdallarchaeota archaeon]
MSLSVIKYRNDKEWFLSHLWRQRFLVLVVFAGIGIVTLTRVMIPVIIGYLIDNTLITRQIGNLVFFLLLTFIVYLVRNTTDYLTMMAGHYLGFKAERLMRGEFFDTVQAKPLRYHDKARTGDLQALATNDLRIINTMIAHGAFYLYPFFQMIMAAFLLFFTLDVRLAFVCIPFALAYMYFVFVFRRKIAPIAAARMVTHSNLSVVFQDTLSGMAVVKAFTAEYLERRKFHEAVKDFRDNRIAETIVQSKFYASLVLYLAIGTTFLASTIFVYQGTLSIGTLTAVNLLLITLIHPTDMIFWATNDMMSGFAACSRLFNIVHSSEEEDNEKDSGIKEPFDLKGRIEFRNVTFSYENSKRKVLNNLSFTIEPNQRVALCGPTGCGKTTLVKLLLRLYDPQEGVILLDGKNVKDYPIVELRRRIGYIEQETYLFSRSIRDNIAFGKPEATNEEILHVAKLSQVDDYVERFPRKYETIIGERGTRLSGGEKQRVAIARAFLTDPRILILDDSTSAVDSETEAKITQAMSNIAMQRTTLIITHRLHVIKGADKVFMLKFGKIVAEGSHEALLQNSEDYRRIFGKKNILPELQVPSMG